MKNNFSKHTFPLFIIFAFLLGGFSWRFFQAPNIIADNLRLDEQEATIRAIKKTSPAVVSIVVSENSEVLTLTQNGYEKRKERVEKGRGTGFVISSDGYILTNKHVVAADKNKQPEYKIYFNSGKEYYAIVASIDPLYDLAVLKIFDKNLPTLDFGDSDKLELGTTVIAIGNALGRYKNSVTKGIISGVERDLSLYSDVGSAEMADLIQTDAEINLGNSGGPLVDLNGKVVGVNTAIDATGASIGFAIPANNIKPAIASIKSFGYIKRPKLGIHYLHITPILAREKKLSSDFGAYIFTGKKEVPAVIPDGPAARAGIQAEDIILEINGVKVEGKNTLLRLMQKYRPNDTITLKISRLGKISSLRVELGEFKPENN